MPCSIALSAAPQFASAAFEELRGVDRAARVVEWMAPAIARVAAQLPYDALVAALRERRPIYTRHICPLQMAVNVSGSEQDGATIMRAAVDLVASSQLELAAPLCVQPRLIPSGLPYTTWQIADDVQSALARPRSDQGDRLWVLSILIGAAQAWLGLSLARDNLNPWPGGERRYARDEHTISRAEFKLQEAIDLFRLALPTSGLALDLGAAPGGWTRLLRLHGLAVIAVDPGDLDPALTADPRVHHVRQLAEPFLRQPSVQVYDVIVNDMRIDIAQSVALMCAAAPRLKPDGVALLTLKLPTRGGPQLVRSALKTLQQSFRVAAVRQLFHNRTEVTVALHSKL